MSKVQIKTPFFMFNPKSYLYGDEMVEMAKVAEEIKKMEYEPLLPVELSLIRWSIGIGVGSLFILYYLSKWLFPGGH